MDGHTYNLIEAVFGKDQAVLFTENRGLDFGKVVGFRLHEKQEYAFFRDKYWVDARLWRLRELIEQLHSLDIRPEFNPEDWEERCA